MKSKLIFSLTLFTAFVLTACGATATQAPSASDSTDTTQSINSIQPVEAVQLATSGYVAICESGLTFEVIASIPPNQGQICSNNAGYFTRFVLPNGISPDVTVSVKPDGTLLAQVGTFVANCSGNLSYSTCNMDVEGYSFNFDVKVSGYIPTVQPTIIPTATFAPAPTPAVIDQTVLGIPEHQAQQPIGNLESLVNDFVREQLSPLYVSTSNNYVIPAFTMPKRYIPTVGFKFVSSLPPYDAIADYAVNYGDAVVEATLTKISDTSYFVSYNVFWNNEQWMWTIYSRICYEPEQFALMAGPDQLGMYVAEFVSC